MKRPKPRLWEQPYSLYDLANALSVFRYNGLEIAEGGALPYPSLVARLHRPGRIGEVIGRRIRAFYAALPADRQREILVEEKRLYFLGLAVLETAELVCSPPLRVGGPAEAEARALQALQPLASRPLRQGLDDQHYRLVGLRLRAVPPPPASTATENFGPD